MVSFEELKKKSAEMEKSKNLESQKKRKSAANEYEEQSKFVEKIDKRKEQIDKTLKEAEFKKKQSKTAFHGAINELKRQFEYAKDNPNSIFSHFFKKDEDGNVLDKIDFKKAKDEEEGIDEIRDSLKDFKKAAKKESQTKKRVANIENIKKKAKNKKEELFKNTDEYLDREYLYEASNYSDIENLRESGHLRFPFKDPKKIIEKESEENIERLRGIYTDKILNDFHKSKKYRELGVDTVQYKKIEDVVRDHAKNSFNEWIGLYKLRKERGDDWFDERSGKYLLEDFDREFKEIREHIYYLENIQRKMDSGVLRGDQKINFEKSHYMLPLLQREIEQIEELEKNKEELELKLKNQKDSLGELRRKNPLFGKSAHQNKLADLENKIDNLKTNLQNVETSIKKNKGNPLGQNNEKYVFESLSKMVDSDLYKIFENGKGRDKKTLAEFLHDDFSKREQAKENITLGEYVEAIIKYVRQAENSYKLKKGEIIIPLKESLEKYLRLKGKTEESKEEFLKLTKS